jgi:lipopolysaccharide biosynthesis regulator YciM
VAEVGLANLHLLQQHEKEAEKLLKQAIQTNPTNAYAHAMLGELLHTLGKKDEALSILTRATTLDRGAIATMAAAVEEAVKTGVEYKYKPPAKAKGKPSGKAPAAKK